MSSFCQNKVCNHQTNNQCQKLLSSVDIYSSRPLLKCRLHAINTFVASWFLNLHSSLVTLRVGSALALLLLKPNFQDHVVNIYSQDYSIMIEKEAIFQPRVFKTRITFAHMNKKMFFSWQITITQLSRVCTLFAVCRASQTQHLQRFLLEETATLTIKKSSQGIPSAVLLSCCIW